MIIGSLLTFCFYTFVQVTGATESYSRMERIKLVVFAPLAFIFMYILSYAEYVATMRGLLSLKKIIREYRHGESTCEWVHVARPDIALQ